MITDQGKASLRRNATKCTRRTPGLYWRIGGGGGGGGGGKRMEGRRLCRWRENSQSCLPRILEKNHRMSPTQSPCRGLAAVKNAKGTAASPSFHTPQFLRLFYIFQVTDIMLGPNQSQIPTFRDSDPDSNPMRLRDLLINCVIFFDRLHALID